MLRINLCLLVVAVSFTSNGQSNNIIHFSYGQFLLPETASNELGNSGHHLEVTSFFPLRAGFNSPKTQFGIEVKMGYSRINKDHEPSKSFDGMRYTNGGPSPIDITLDLITYGKTRGVHLLAGPSIFFSKKNFFFSPSLSAGISSVSRQGYEYIDTVRHGSDPSQDKVIVFESHSEASAIRFTVNPSFKTGWWLNQRIGVSLGAQYIYGPRLGYYGRYHSTGVVRITPHTYTYDELVNGGTLVADGWGPWDAFTVQLNLSVRLPGTK